MSIERFPNAPTTPTYFLHKLLDHIGEIESVLAVVAWKDAEGKISHQVCWTSQPLERMATADVACHAIVTKEIMDGYND